MRVSYTKREESRSLPNFSVCFFLVFFCYLMSKLFTKHFFRNHTLEWLCCFSNFSLVSFWKDCFYFFFTPSRFFFLKPKQSLAASAETTIDLFNLHTFPPSDYFNFILLKVCDWERQAAWILLNKLKWTSVKVRVAIFQWAKQDSRLDTFPVRACVACGVVSDKWFSHRERERE